jgi:hypothetical protein
MFKVCQERVKKNGTAELEFVNVYGAQESIPPACVVCSLPGRYVNRIVVPVRQAGNRFLVFLKGLQIRALVGRGNSRTKIRNDIIKQISGFQGGNKHTEKQTNK